MRGRGRVKVGFPFFVLQLTRSRLLNDEIFRRGLNCSPLCRSVGEAEKKRRGKMGILHPVQVESVANEFEFARLKASVRKRKLGGLPRV